MLEHSLHQPDIATYLAREAQIIILALAPDGIIIAANPHAQSVLGFDPCKKHFNQLCALPDTAINPAAPADGVPFAVTLTTAMGLPQTFYFNGLSRPSHLLLLGRTDHTEMVTLQQELVALNNASHTLNRRLQKQAVELTQLNHLKNDFLGMAAHDLRTPLSSIISFSQFLVDEADTHQTPRQHEFLSIILSAGQRMLHLINDFLDISMIESGNLRLNLKPVDLLDVLGNSIIMSEIWAAKKEIKLVPLHTREHFSITVDGPKIEQVLNNLLSNAIDHAPRGSQIYIHIDQAEDGLQVMVRDQGPGIAAEEQPGLFKAFAQGRNTTRDQGKHAGLGLAISQAIIKAHGGRIWIESQPGKGCTLAFSLPL